MIYLRKAPKSFALCFLVWAAVSPAAALDLGEKVRLNGFGGWAAGQTDGNGYLAGEEDREYDAITFSLSATANVSDELTINAQIHSDSEGEEVVTGLDFAFAEWAFSDALRLRGGLVKQPFGIYTEIFDVGTVRPFFDLPVGIYGPSEFVAEAYQGLGITGYRQAGSGWGVAYDVYGGEVILDSTEAANPLLFGHDGEEELEPDEKVKDVLGGRLKLYVPGGKLSFGVSAYFGKPDEEGEEEPELEEEVTTQRVFGVHAEYVASEWSLRAEYLHRVGGDEEVSVDAAYVELARFFGEHWQLAARYDWAERDPEEEVGVPRDLLEHEDRALSLNYWLSTKMVFKLSYHVVDGLLYAHPEEADELDGETNLVQLGLQFSF